MLKLLTMILSIILQCILVSWATAKCSDTNLAHPLPKYNANHPVLRDAFAHLGALLDITLSNPDHDSASLSVEVTSSKETLWGHYHTARKRNESRPDIPEVNGDALYRIASVTKAFTVLAILQQHEAGTLRLDDPVTKFLPELEEKQNGTILWTGITLRSLASQLSGIPREFGQDDLLNPQLYSLLKPEDLGLPPVSRDGLPQCDEYSPDYQTPCTGNDLLRMIKGYDPIFRPNQQSSYSNVAFELLGLVIEKVANQTYESYIEDNIFKPLGMSKSTLFRPKDSAAVIPVWPHYFDVDEGVQNPTGGIYSSATDLSKFLRYVLTHYNTISPSVNWLNVASSSLNLNSFYGMPWEIFQTDRVLASSQRTVRFVTKGGGLPSYLSHIIMLPEYDIGITLLTAGSMSSGLLTELMEMVTVQVTRAVEQYAIAELEQLYAGRFISPDPKLNSSITLVADHRGLILESFISNGSDVLSNLLRPISGDAPNTVMQLVPTLQYRDEKAKRGDKWRFIPIFERKAVEDRGVWDDFCVADVDMFLYGGRVFNEAVMWQAENGGSFNDIELPAYRINLTRIIAQSDIQSNSLENMEL